MHAPTPDPPGRPSSANLRAGPGTPDPTKGSTGLHRPGEPSLSDLLSGTSGSSQRGPNAADLAAHLATVDGPAPPGSDDAPTVITQAGRPAPPPPPYVLGESPSIAGRRLGHFELIESIGAGGMAAVLKARDLDLGRTVALKILPPESVHDPENVTRFKQEARAAAKLDHENIARVYFCGEDQGLYFIAFEFVDGVTLRQLIDRRGPLPAGECVRYLIQVAAGLNHAAERGVVHRDVKPSNVIITPDGRAKIVDMGLARHLDAGSVNGGVTQSGVTLGTFDYISPEQALDPRRADVRSDIYSLGCAFYHALTGRPPVPPGTAARKINAHQFVDPLDPRDLNPAVPDELAAVLARMMAKDPGRRYQSPTELIAHLKAVAAQLSVPSDALGSDTTVHAILPDARVLPEAPHLRLGWVAAAVAVVAAVVVIISATGPTPSPTPTPWPPGSGSVRKEEAASPGKGIPSSRPTPSPRAESVTVATVEQLADALADPHTTRIRLAAGDYDLTGLARPVASHGAKLELLGTGSKTVVRVAAAPRDRAGAAPAGALTLRAKHVAVHGVRFEIVHPPLLEEGFGIGENDPAGLVILDATRVDLQDCAFIPDEAAREAGVTAVDVGAAGDAVVQTQVERCLFAPGGVGLRVPTRSAVAVEDSGFGPHAAALLVHGDPAPPSPDSDAAEKPAPLPVRLDRSAFMLDPNTAVVRVESAVAPEVRVTAGYCVFAPARAGAADPPGAVVRVAGPDLVGARYRGAVGRKNVYFHTDPVATAARGYTFEDCKDLPGLPADDPGRVAVRQRPWDADGSALAPFESPAADPYRAFRLRVAGPDADADLLVADPKVRVVGARFTRDPGEGTGTRVYPRWPPHEPALAAGVTQKVWYPEAPTGHPFGPGEYRNLVVLLQDAKSGDEIHIRHDGPLALPQQVIEAARATAGADRGEFHLTFKPNRGSQPVLVPAASDRLDVSLFRVVEGRVAVTYEGLNFVVKHGSAQDVAAVTLVAGQRCEFRNCTFTLDANDGQVAAVVSLADTGREMKLDGPAARSVPRVAFTNCLIRGKGRALSVPVSRPFDLSVDNSVTALNGPIVYTHAAGRDPGVSAASPVHLSHVTALLGGPVVELRGGKVGEMRASGLVPVTVTASGCLFAAVPSAGRSLVEVHDTELDRADPNRVLKWERDKPNRFANFGAVAPATIYPGNEAAQTWDWTQWTTFAGEVVGPVGKVVFADEPDGLRDLANVRPAHAEVLKVDFPTLDGAKPGDAGADVEKVAAPPDSVPNDGAGPG